jgi:hypothetical protein
MAIPPGARPVSDISEQIGHPSRTG